MNNRDMREFRSKINSLIEFFISLLGRDVYNNLLRGKNLEHMQIYDIDDDKD